MEVICLDTNILIDHKRAKEKGKTRFYQLALQGYSFKITSISVYELFKGDNSAEDEHWISFFEKVEILDFDYSSAKIAGNIFRDLKNIGSLIDISDILIAAISIKNGLVLATENKRHFNRIKGLHTI